MFDMVISYVRNHLDGVGKYFVLASWKFDKTLAQIHIIIVL